MCKVTIKKVEKVLPVKSGRGDRGPWSLHLFECLVEVDDSGKDGIRTLKTFDAGVARQIEDGAGKTFEAKQQGEQAPFSYKIDPERSGFRNKGGRSASEPFGPTNRQAALRYAVELERAQSATCDEIPTPAMILETAEKFLAWLEQGDSHKKHEDSQKGGAE